MGRSSWVLSCCCLSFGCGGLQASKRKSAALGWSGFTGGRSVGLVFSGLRSGVVIMLAISGGMAGGMAGDRVATGEGGWLSSS